MIMLCEWTDHSGVLLLCGAGCSFCLFERYCQLSTLRSNWSHLQCCSVVMGRSMSTTHPPTATTINQSCVESREPEFGCFSRPELLPGVGCLKGTFWRFRYFIIFILIWCLWGSRWKFQEISSTCFVYKMVHAIIFKNVKTYSITLCNTKNNPEQKWPLSYCYISLLGGWSR